MARYRVGGGSGEDQRRMWAGLQQNAQMLTDARRNPWTKGGANWRKPVMQQTMGERGQRLTMFGGGGARNRQYMTAFGGGRYQPTTQRRSFGGDLGAGPGQTAPAPAPNWPGMPWMGSGSGSGGGRDQGQGYRPTPVDPWTPNVPSPPEMGSAPSVPAPLWGSTQANNMPGLGNLNEWMNNWDNERRQQIANYYNMSLPWVQAQQNAQQWATEFQEQARRWDAQTAWQRAMDQYNMGLTGRQQQMAEWQAQEAARQWAEQFGFQSNLQTRQQSYYEEQRNRELAMQEWLNRQNIGLGSRRLDLQDWMQREQMAFQREQLAQQMGLSRDELASLERWRQAQAQNLQAQVGLRGQELAMQEWLNRQNVGLGSRRVGIEEFTARQNVALRQRELAQQAALERERIRAMLEQARYAQFGRSLAPNVRWIRNWG